MGISVQQLLIILAIIVLLFGAKKIPELAKGLGKGIKSFKAEMEDEKPVEKVEEKTSDVKTTEAKVEEKTQA
ncbi:Sec-independent protein translocase subunit TatA/TatB [Campylobacter suis]|uniref:Sec-independent protein translocase protein TatA n=1 Tax=Campylobacter suis TaxID=2790657 RepID=A0ABN7K844_9BACT|nr:twin-arginine translocase TatA/TatE family subunit [Campylobacter suis]CAD7288679.1 Sec-independent protein translocase protein TatA [Campylobacter suis]